MTTSVETLCPYPLSPGKQNKHKREKVSFEWNSRCNVCSGTNHQKPQGNKNKQKEGKANEYYIGRADGDLAPSCTCKGIFCGAVFHPRPLLVVILRWVSDDPHTALPNPLVIRFLFDVL